uniref:Uncharacterized protein n=1 Tax=Meloidogyne enterolobii TaxID=390850 RepID=A0A6V7WGM3_MELEN|nr:unnamed protein product [Meloidogyne enterolobii]
MRTPKQSEEWAFSANNSDNNKTLGEELENFIGKSNLETSSISDLSTCCSSNNINKSLKQRIEKLEIKMEKKNLSLEKSNFDLEKRIQELKFKHEDEIRNLKQNFHKLNEEINKLKAENCQKDEKFNSLEEEIDKKIQKLNSDHKNEIEEIKQNLKQKDEKINSLMEEIKKEKEKNACTEYKNEIEILNQKMNETFDKKFGDLIKLNSLNCLVSLSNYIVFVRIKNKWSEIYGECCYKECINTKKPIGNCKRGVGFVNIINDENIKYINCLEGKGVCDEYGLVSAKNPFKKHISILIIRYIILKLNVK